MDALCRLFPCAILLLICAAVMAATGFPLPALSQSTPAVSPSYPPFKDIKSLTEAIDGVYQPVADYRLKGYIRIEGGSLVIDYRCRRPDTIRTEILEGKGRGTVVLYVPEQRKDQVKAKSGAFRVWRRISRLRIANTPLVESLLDTVLKTMKESSDARFLGDVHVDAQLGAALTVTLTPDPFAQALPAPASSLLPSVTPLPLVTPPSGTPLPSVTPPPSVQMPDDKGYDKALGLGTDPDEGPGPVESPKVQESPAAGGAHGEAQTFSRDCYLVEIRNNETIDIMAVDRSTCWPVYARRTSGGKLVFEAVITSLVINTSPAMDL